MRGGHESRNAQKKTYLHPPHGAEILDYGREDEELERRHDQTRREENLHGRAGGCTARKDNYGMLRRGEGRSK